MDREVSFFSGNFIYFAPEEGFVFEYFLFGPRVGSVSWNINYLDPEVGFVSWDNI